MFPVYPRNVVSGRTWPPSLLPILVGSVLRSPEYEDFKALYWDECGLMACRISLRHDYEVIKMFLFIPRVWVEDIGFLAVTMV